MTAPKPSSITTSEIEAFLTAQQAAITSQSTTEDAVSAGLTAFMKTRLQNAQSLLNKPINREDVLALMRDPQHPLAKAMALLSGCGARIDQDAQQRRPSSPIVWRTWELQTILAILAIFDIPSPNLPE